MAVTITAPQSKVLSRGAVTPSWSPGYPQSSYEIQHWEAGETAWSTFGQVSGSVTSVTMDLSVFEDFKLYYYRVVCYASNATSGISTYNGSDFSAAYALMVVPANQVATMKIKYGDDMICESHQNITIDQLRAILGWISQTPMNHIGIIGGEPTLHPHFDEILKEVNQYCRELHTDATLFTNGIYLDKWIQYIGNDIGILINYNSPEEMLTEQFAKLSNTMEHLHLLDWFNPERPKANIGCNLYIQRENYDFIWEAVDRYHLGNVHVSVTAPITEEHRKNKEAYYSAMKDRFLKFCQAAKDRRIRLGADCNQIPDCYFNKSELDLVYEVMGDSRHNGICNPVIDITPDFKATACFGCYDPVDCSLFPTLIDLERYLLHKKTYPSVLTVRTTRC